MAFVHPSRRALVPQASHPAPLTDRVRDRSHDRNRGDEENMYRRDGGFDGGGDYFERCAASILLLISENLSSL